MGDSIVLNDELVLSQFVQDVAVLGLDGGRDQDDVRLRPERVALVVCCRRILRCSDGGADNKGREELPHRFQV